MRHPLAALLLLTLTLVQRSAGHGYLIEPPCRSSMWRAGFPTPQNYNDNNLSCGGSRTRCGICGDPPNGDRPNEVGGKYATGTVSRTYTEGQEIDIGVVVTANHVGWFEFSLCPYSDVSKEVTEDCLQKHVLSLTAGGIHYQLAGSTYGRVNVRAKLPDGLTCTRCLLRWKWKTGNSWGVDRRTGRGCMGCGLQEMFYGCADVAISSKSEVDGTTPAPHTSAPRTPEPVTPPPPQTSSPQTPRPQTPTPRTPLAQTPSTSPLTPSPLTPSPLTPSPLTRSPLTPSPLTPKPFTFNPMDTQPPILTHTPDTPAPQPATGGHLTCHGVATLNGVGDLDAWCQRNCNTGIFCPDIYCQCKVTY